MIGRPPLGVVVYGREDWANLLAVDVAGVLVFLECGTRRQLVRLALQREWRVLHSFGELACELLAGRCVGLVRELARLGRDWSGELES